MGGWEQEIKKLEEEVKNKAGEKEIGRLRDQILTKEQILDLLPKEEQLTKSLKHLITEET